jgi:uncharacterized protein YeeX (DUF496 family)
MSRAKRKRKAAHKCKQIKRRNKASRTMRDMEASLREMRGVLAMLKQIHDYFIPPTEKTP